MASRPTPFGLSAGISIGSIGESTDLVLAPRAQWRRHTRLDMDFLWALVQRLRDHPPLASGWTWFPNPTIYRSGQHLRYIETRMTGEARTYHLVSVDTSDELDTALAVAKAGTTSEAVVA